MKPLQDNRLDYLVLPGARVNNASYTSNYVDTKGYQFAHVMIRLGATDIAMAALKLQHSDKNDGTGLTDISGCDFSVAPATLPTSGNTNKAFTIDVDLRGKKRYLYLVATAGNGTLGTYLISECLLALGDVEPNTAALKNVAQAIRG